MLMSAARAPMAGRILSRAARVAASYTSRSISSHSWTVPAGSVLETAQSRPGCALWRRIRRGRGCDELAVRPDFPQAVRSYPYDWASPPKCNSSLAPFLAVYTEYRLFLALSLCALALAASRSAVVGVRRTVVQPATLALPVQRAFSTGNFDLVLRQADSALATVAKARELMLAGRKDHPRHKFRSAPDVSCARPVSSHPHP